MKLWGTWMLQAPTPGEPGTYRICYCAYIIGSPLLCFAGFGTPDRLGFDLDLGPDVPLSVNILLAS